jgi:hypothetical protein
LRTGGNHPGRAGGGLRYLDAFYSQTHIEEMAEYPETDDGHEAVHSNLPSHK